MTQTRRTVDAERRGIREMTRSDAKAADSGPARGWAGRRPELRGWEGPTAEATTGIIPRQTNPGFKAAAKASLALDPNIWCSSFFLVH